MSILLLSLKFCFHIFVQTVVQHQFVTFLRRLGQSKRLYSVFTHVASIYAYLLEQKKVFT